MFNNHNRFNRVPIHSLFQRLYSKSNIDDLLIYSNVEFDDEVQLANIDDLTLTVDKNSLINLKQTDTLNLILIEEDFLKLASGDKIKLNIYVGWLNDIERINDWQDIDEGKNVDWR